MLYLPQQYINSNYKYTINSDSYLIRTHNNCYTQYSTEYCDCFYVYYKNNYAVGDTYSCSYNTNSNSNISYTQFTKDVFYRYDITSILVCFIILIIFCFYFPYKVLSRFFGRWLKI